MTSGTKLVRSTFGSGPTGSGNTRVGQRAMPIGIGIGRATTRISELRPHPKRAPYEVTSFAKFLARQEFSVKKQNKI